MSDVFHLTAELRQPEGKGATRRLRRLEDRIPAIIYGAGKEPQAISLQHKDVLMALGQEAVFSHILTISVDGKKEQVVLKDIARHAFKPKVLHIDFLRVKAKEAITMNVPIHFIGEEEAPGIKVDGVFSKLLTEVEIKCLPANLPEFIELNVSQLEMDETLHLSDLKLPKGVEFTHEVDEDHDQPVASIHKPKVEAEPEPVEEAEEAAAEGEAKAEENGGEAEKPEDSAEG